MRWLGDRKGIEKLTKTWDKTIVDRAPQLKNWVDYLSPIKKRGVTIYAYANNHYAGHGPATVARFLEMWEKVEPTSKRAPDPGKQPLFG